MRHIFSLSWLAGLLLTAAPAFQPAQAQVAATVQLRTVAPLFAGPGYGYPRVEYIYPGHPLRLYGCIYSNDWCDVASGHARGWVPANSLFVHRGNRYYGLSRSRTWYPYPFVNFVFRNYWNDHYRNRPWYHDRSHWNRWDHRPDRFDGHHDRWHDERARPNHPTHRDRNHDGRQEGRIQGHHRAGTQGQDDRRDTSRINRRPHANQDHD